MDIYRSKEVCKHVVVDGEHKLVPVRGVYVASEFRPPYNTNFLVSIEAIDGTPATVTEFSTRDLTVYQGDCHADMIISDVASANVTYYTIANATAYQDTISYVSINISNEEPTVVYYTRNYETCYDDRVHADITITSPQATVIDIPTSPNDTNDFIVSIVGISSNQATITTIT